MTMTQQAIAAENARRIIGQIESGADIVGCRGRIVYDIEITQTRPGKTSRVQRAALEAADAITTINWATESGEVWGRQITFRIHPRFPAFEASANDVAVLRNGE